MRDEWVPGSKSCLSSLPAIAPAISTDLTTSVPKNCLSVNKSAPANFYGNRPTGQRTPRRATNTPLHAKRPGLERSMSATCYYLPNINKWKYAQQVYNKKVETENDENGEYEESGSDLSDCETESAVSTLVSQVSTLSLDAVSDTNIDEMGDCIPLLRAPPFPFLSTTIRFVYPDTTILSAPSRLPKLLWKNSTLTPRVVKRIIRHSHFELVETGKAWLGLMGKHLKGHNYKKLKSGQKVNHFPGCFVIGRKDRLWRTISRFIAKFGHGEFGFIPTTYILPRDRRLLKENWHNNETFILKPVASARGIGIKILNKFEQVPRKRAVVVQKYIKNPLLINELKWDLRIYVYVSSFSPLIAYIFEDGLVRFATDRFSMNTKRRFVHLTNYSVNKKSKNFHPNHNADEAVGHKWSLRVLWSKLEEMGYRKNEIWQDIKDIVLKTLIASEGHIVTQLHKNCANQRNCFELFGFDIMLDKKGKVILIEVNVSPALHSNSKLDQDIKGNLMADVLNTTGFSPYKPKPPPTITSADRQANAKLLKKSDEITNKEILQNLSPYHRYLILNIEYERQRKGKLERLIPAPGVWKTYKRFFETIRVDNIVLSAFEDEYGSNDVRRRTGTEYIFRR